MELFTVNRYDATKLNEKDERVQEELILQQLQARKERKKRQRASKTPGEVEPTPDLPLEGPEVGSTTNASQETGHNGASEEGIQDESIDERELEQVPEQEQEVPAESEQLGDTENETEKTKREPDQARKDNDGNKLGDFIVLGGDKLQRLQKTEEILPPWLSHPTVVDCDLTVKGPSIKKQPYLDEAIKSNLRKMGYKRLFPVQEKVIPWILEAHRKPAPFWARDVCISSPTGSGKTLAFAVPIVQLLLKRVAPAVRALVILPVQELAEQVYLVFRDLCEGTNIRPVFLSRTMVFENEQKKLVKYCNGEYVPKVDIVVTTAGRLVEHLHSTKGFTLRQLRFLIVDEADQVMDQIQNDWLYHLNKHVKHESDEYLLGRNAELLSQTQLFDRPRQPHKLLFSATFKRDAEKLKTLKLFHPKLFTTVNNLQETSILAQQTGVPEQRRGNYVGQYTTPLELKELVCVTNIRIKPLTLYALIRENGYRKFLVFTNGIDASHRLSFVLQRLFGTELVIEEWSSSLSPADRRSVLSRFSMGKVNGIICTDALSRGIDIENIEVVISYDMPRHVDTYIHRIGRTARAGNRGTSITMLLENERKKFNTLLSVANKEELDTIEIKPTAEEEFAVKYASALNDLREAMELETEVINKIRNGMSIGSMTKVNLLTKLKDQVDITYSTDIIKSLKYLPKSWTNEAIENKAVMEKNRNKVKSKSPALNGDAAGAKSVDTIKTVKSEVNQGKSKLKRKQKTQNLSNGSATNVSPTDKPGRTENTVHLKSKPATNKRKLPEENGSDNAHTKCKKPRRRKIIHLLQAEPDNSGKI